MSTPLIHSGFRVCNNLSWMSLSASLHGSYQWSGNERIDGIPIREWILKERNGWNVMLYSICIPPKSRWDAPFPSLIGMKSCFPSSTDKRHGNREGNNSQSTEFFLSIFFFYLKHPNKWRTSQSFLIYSTPS